MPGQPISPLLVSMGMGGGEEFLAVIYRGSMASGALALLKALDMQTSMAEIGEAGRFVYNETVALAAHIGAFGIGAGTGYQFQRLLFFDKMKKYSMGILTKKIKWQIFILIGVVISVLIFALEVFLIK